MTYHEFVKEACPPLDLVWRKYRRRSARHRVDRRIAELGLSGYGAYLERLQTDPPEAARLPDLMLVTVTRFFREEKAWRELREVVLPSRIPSTASPGTVRAWSAGCCGGEEPYSLAISWLEYLQPCHPEWSMEIIATDIDQASLDRARRAVYDVGSLRELPRPLRSRWFSKVDSLWRINDEALSLVRFQRQNLLSDAAPQEIDLALCRYLAFTYYRGDRLLAALRKLWEALVRGGVLMIGAKEQLPSAASELFEPLSESRLFYRKIG